MTFKDDDHVCPAETNPALPSIALMRPSYQSRLLFILIYAYGSYTGEYIRIKCECKIRRSLVTQDNLVKFDSYLIKTMKTTDVISTSKYKSRYNGLQSVINIRKTTTDLSKELRKRVK